MLFLFAKRSIALFHYNQNQLILQPSDNINVKFSGIRSKKFPFQYNLNFGNAICQSNTSNSIRSSFGQNILGDFRTKTIENINFLEDQEFSCRCFHTLSEEQAEILNYLSENDYLLYFQLKNFKMKQGFHISEGRYFLTKYKFDIQYATEVKSNVVHYKIIDIVPSQEIGHQTSYSDNVCTELQTPPIIKEGTNVSLTYQFTFTETKLYPPSTMQPTFALSSLKLQLLINIAILAFLLYFTPKYSNSFGPLEEQTDDSVWYYLRGDLFRMPQNISILCTFCGIGVQTIFSLLYMSLKSYGEFSDVVSTFFSVMSWSGIICGFVSMFTFKYVGGYEWRNVYKAILTLTPALFVLIFCIRSLLFIFTKSASSPTNGTILHIMVLVLIHTISVSIGSTVGLKFPINDTPCKVNMIPRHVPASPFYMSPGYLRVYGGIYLFISILVVLLTISESERRNSSLDSPKSFMIMTIFILILSSSNISLTFTFLKAKSDDYHWWWTSFMSPAFVSVIYLIYCFSFSYVSEGFQGFLPFLFNSTTYIVKSAVLFVVCGSAGFISSFLFLNNIISQYFI